VRDLLTYIPFRIAAGIFGWFPEPWVRALGQWAGRRSAARGSDKRQLLASHMRRVRGTVPSDDEIGGDVDRMYESYGRYWAETFWLRERRHSEILDRVERINFEPVFQARDEGRAIIYALAHLGNWEVAGLRAREIGTPTLAVAEDLSNQRITRWFVKVRNSVGIDIVLTSDRELRSKLLRRLRDGGAIALVADRDVTGSGNPVEFFGEVTRMPSGPAALAVLTGALLVPIGVYFQEGAGHRIVVREPIEVTDDSDRRERIATTERRLALELEVLVRDAPSQWHLFQPNWPSDEGYE
jgi:lauroyl/myristoyl acyltransferase